MKFGVQCIFSNFCILQLLKTKTRGRPSRSIVLPTSNATFRTKIQLRGLRGGERRSSVVSPSSRFPPQCSRNWWQPKERCTGELGRPGSGPPCLLQPLHL